MNKKLNIKPTWTTILMLALAIATGATPEARALGAIEFSEAYKRNQAAQEKEEYDRKAKERSDRLVESSTSPSAARSDQYAAIAYSPSTRTCGYSYRYTSLAAARRAAVGECKAADAVAVNWAANGWYCAVALGADGSWGTASGPTATAARAAALKECRKSTTTECWVEVCVGFR